MVKKANEYFGQGVRLSPPHLSTHPPYTDDNPKQPPQVITNSWFLFILATDPAHQRKGYGSMLVRAGLRLVRSSPVFTPKFAPSSYPCFVPLCPPALSLPTDWSSVLGRRRQGESRHRNMGLRTRECITTNTHLVLETEKKNVAS